MIFLEEADKDIRKPDCCLVTRAVATAFWAGKNLKRDIVEPVFKKLQRVAAAGPC